MSNEPQVECDDNKCEKERGCKRRLLAQALVERGEVVTKDEPIDDGIKSDEGKLRWDLLPLDALEEIVRVYTYGLKEHSDYSWQKLSAFESRYFSAMMRHAADYKKGKRFDESGILVTAHLAWNAIALLWKEIQKGE